MIDAILALGLLMLYAGAIVGLAYAVLRPFGPKAGEAKRRRQRPL